MKSKSLISKLLAFFCCTVLLLTSYSVYCAQDKTTVYVAGNANMYPLEYYDASSKQYLGLMPELYGLISEKTGYDFVYINAGKLNAQERMAKNCQADIISVYSEGDIDEKYIKSVHTVLVMQVDGEEKRVNIAFSDVASDKLISDISGALSEISQDKMLSLLASHASENENDSYYKIWIYILSAVIIAFLIAAGAVIVYVLKKKKLNKKNTMIDEHYGIGNDKYYIYCFNNLISDKSRALYYIAYIAFDNEGFARKYGSAEVKSVQRYVSEFLSNKAGAVEYLSIISDGVFAFVYQSSNREDAKKRISDIIEALNTYLKNIKTEYTKLFAAGVCVLEDNMDCTAESAFYHAKQVYIYAVKNKTPFEFGTKNIVEQAKRNESLQRQIVQAISGGEFMIYLQYIVDRKGKITGAEAVSRWQNPRGGLLTPSNYIDMINQSDTISLHDFYIFSLVCRKLEEWKHSGKDDLFISCNFTRYTITSPDFSDKIYEIAEKYDFNYNRLIIEVTEDSFADNITALRTNINKCKEKGFLIALDDIGCGYSSLSDLYNYPIDFVKVERKIVLNAMEPKGRMLLNGLINLAHSMDIECLCEGVETDEQNEIVLNACCDYIQGYFYSRALPGQEADRFFEQYSG